MDALQKKEVMKYLTVFERLDLLSGAMLIDLINEGNSTTYAGAALHQKSRLDAGLQAGNLDLTSLYINCDSSMKEFWFESTVASAGNEYVSSYNLSAKTSSKDFFNDFAKLYQEFASNLMYDIQQNKFV
jgi:hypothetical protein